MVMLNSATVLWDLHTQDIIIDTMYLLLTGGIADLKKKEEFWNF